MSLAAAAAAALLVGWVVRDTSAAAGAVTSQCDRLWLSNSSSSCSGAGWVGGTITSAAASALARLCDGSYALSLDLRLQVIAL
jgi:hypothetical protein